MIYEAVPSGPSDSGGTDRGRLGVKGRDGTGGFVPDRLPGEITYMGNMDVVYMGCN